MNLTFVKTKDYENKSNWTLGENEPKTNPICGKQTQPVRHSISEGGFAGSIYDLKLRLLQNSVKRKDISYRSISLNMMGRREDITAVFTEYALGPFYFFSYLFSRSVRQKLLNINTTVESQPLPVACEAYFDFRELFLRKMGLWNDISIKIQNFFKKLRFCHRPIIFLLDSQDNIW